LLYLDSDWVSNCYAVAKSLMSEFVNLIHVRGFYFSIRAHQRQAKSWDKKTSSKQVLVMNALPDSD